MVCFYFMKLAGHFRFLFHSHCIRGHAFPLKDNRICFAREKTCNLFLYHALAEGLSARGYGCGTQVCLASSVHIKRFRFTFLSFVDWFTIGPKQNSRGWQRRQKQYWRLITQDKKRHEYMCRPALKWDFNWVRGGVNSIPECFANHKIVPLRRDVIRFASRQSHKIFRENGACWVIRITHHGVEIRCCCCFTLQF